MPSSTRGKATRPKAPSPKSARAKVSPAKPISKPASPKASTKKPATTRKRATAPPSPPAHRYLSGNALVCGDNLDILKELPAECVDLVYLDPPFNSNHNYVAAFGDKGTVDAQLRDIWRWTVETENSYQRLPHGKLLNAVNAVRLVAGETSPMAAYAVFMVRRLAELHRVLKPTGSIYLHCDPNANWLLRMALDSIFGEGNFQNELIWRRTTAHSDSGRYGANTDSILFYSKGKQWTWNPQFQDYDEKYKARFNRKDPDGRLWTDDNLTAKGLSGGGYEYEYKGATSLWRVPLKTMRRLDKEGRLHFTNAGGIRRKRYLDELEGRPLQSLWDDISPVNSQATERLGYPTQKPLALLERIIQASSDPGSIVLDPFCGCGTAADAAAKLGRKYLGIDVSAIAVRVMQQRLDSRGGKATPVVYKMGWEDYEWEHFEKRALMSREDAEDGQPGWAWAEDKVAGLLNALPNERKVGDGGVDARYYTEKGQIIPIQVKMHRNQIGRQDLQRLLGVMVSGGGKKMPMSLMVTLYPPSDGLRLFARQQGNVTLQRERYPKMQVLSVQEMLTKEERPKLPPVDPRYIVGDTQTRLALT